MVGFRKARLEDSGRNDHIVRRAVARAREGDPDALHYLYVRYADNVYAYVASVVRNHHDAEDVTQQVFAKLMVVLDKYDERDVPFSHWLLRMARNQAIDTLRRRRSVPVGDVHVADEGVYQPRSFDTIEDALAGLPADQRTVLVLRHVVGLSPGEIAEQLDRSMDSIHALHKRGRVTLKSELRRRGLAPATMPARPRRTAGAIERAAA